MVRVHIRKGIVPSYEELLSLVQALGRRVDICVQAGESKALETALRVVHGQQARIRYM
ncbi:MAG: hypothetical protein ACKKL4_01020 [Patescibacteria group bacterium]